MRGVRWYGVVMAGFVALAGPAVAASTVGDIQIGVGLEAREGAVRETAFQVAGQGMGQLTGAPVQVRIDGQDVEPRFVFAEGKAGGSDGRSAVLVAEDEWARWELTYTVSGPGRITKTLTLVPRKAARLERVALWASAGLPPEKVSRTALQDIAAFFREGDHELFVSLDFPYSKIEARDGLTTVSYPPYAALKAGEKQVCHALTFGAVALTGRSRYGFDDGEVAAIDAYVQERFTPRFERPMYITCSIVNLYTQVQGDVVFYTMKDHPTLRDHTDLLEGDLALAPKLGMEYYQVFPGVFDWGPNDPSPEQVDRLMGVARRHGVRMGDYSGTSSVFCGHYNEYRNHLDKPEWLVRGANGQPAGGFCFGCDAFVDWYIQTAATNCKRYGFEIHCLDFLSIAPCHAANHQHPAGAESIYSQVAGLVRLLEALNAVSPQMMTWSNSGNFGEFLPKLAWTNPNLYLTDPFIATPWQGLNMTRLLDDARREQMVSLHYQRFIPYRFLTNCQYFFSQNSVSPDIRNFEYGALSTLAVTPNLCLAEIRPWLDRLNETNRERVLAFYQHWTAFVRENFELWKKTYNAGENPGPGAVEIYGHAAGKHGFIFVVNPQYWERTVEIPLDGTLGFAGEGRCEVRELYPVERWRLTPQGRTVALGTKWALRVPAQQVIVLEVEPATERLEEPRLYGLPGTVEKDGEGYLVKTRGPQGQAERFAVALPEGAKAIRSATVRADVPAQPLRLRAETPLRLVAAEEKLATMEVTFRRTAAPSELRAWTVRPAELEAGLKENLNQGWTGGETLRFPLFVDSGGTGVELPLSDARADELGLSTLANFCGAYIEHAFSEEQETWISLGTSGVVTTQPAAEAGTSKATGEVEKYLYAAKAGETPATPGYWLETRFHLPFMYMIGSEPPVDEHTLLVLPLLRQTRCKAIQAWVNGAPLEVRAYRYPRNRALGCYYADLVGTGAHGGENVVVIWVKY